MEFGHSDRPPLDDGPTIFRVGDLLVDTYEIRAILGEGGMGQVFDAHDRGLGRRVAIKANFAEMAKQFPVRTEAQALAAIRHPGVVGVYALCTHQGTEFMVMEHVSGVTLAHHLERFEALAARATAAALAQTTQPAPLGERLDVLIAIADGLAAIHRAGISHGDVKPENVLLAASGRVVLTDLGLVRAAYEPDSGLIAGTPEYMAPEIFSPRYPPAERHLVDVYAFGVLAYRMLADKAPYQADDDLDLLMMHADSPVPKLSDVAKVPKRLSELVESLMAKDPTDRPPSMDPVVWQLRSAREELARAVVTATASSSAGTQPAPSVLSVLVVDDDPDIAKLVGMFVKQAVPGAEVVLANDAHEALACFRKKPPRLVFLDLNMPKMSGFELFTYLRGAHLVDASTVVAMSAAGSPTDAELMLELGVHDFIPKGTELRTRVMKITSMLAGK